MNQSQNAGHLYFNIQKRAHDCYEVVVLEKYALLVLSKINRKGRETWVGEDKTKHFPLYVFKENRGFIKTIAKPYHLPHSILKSSH